MALFHKGLIMQLPEMKVDDNHIAWTGIGIAFFLYLGDVGNLFAEYQNWEFISTTAFVGALLKLTASYGAAALGGGAAMSVKNRN